MPTHLFSKCTILGQWSFGYCLTQSALALADEPVRNLVYEMNRDFIRRSLLEVIIM